MYSPPPHRYFILYDSDEPGFTCLCPEPTDRMQFRSPFVQEQSSLRKDDHERSHVTQNPDISEMIMCH
ncbi:hypothetical protein Pdw03_7885 [Penicillium digitatum]|uniref:Uncharacterized protein n=1 Tax=Penicillium digitatum TaxID=36651 RepID=A0A7T7BLA3_PENDI|nr:hypothetical protein Pdw03_7885 [Penicillium digitatum]